MPVSIVICTRNRIKSLQRSLEKLLAVETTYNWELVVVNNGSDDGTQPYLDSLPKTFNKARVVTMFERRVGLGAARNSGWRTARGEIISFIDDDCYVQSDFIDQMITVFSESAELGFVGGRILLFDHTDLPMTIQVKDELLRLLPYTFIPAGTIQGANIAFRRSTLECIGGFDETLGAGTPFPCEDIDAVAAALWTGIPGAYDPRPTVFHHHGRKTSQEARDLLLCYDWGRGAYFAKYILNRPTRLAYAKAWARSIAAEIRADIRGHRIPSLRRSRREFLAGLQYVIRRSRMNY